MFDTYQEIFDLRGQSYDAAMRRLPLARQAEFAALVTLAGLRPGWQVCDTPAGGGYMADHVPAGVRLTLVESSPVFQALNLAKSDTDCLLADGDRLPLADGTQDAVLSLAGLHHNPNQPGFYAEAWRVLKPGGVLCFADVLADSPVAIFLDDFIGSQLQEGHRGHYLTPQTPEIVARAGFEIDQIRQLQVDWRFDCEADRMWFCRTLFGITATADDEIRRAIAALGPSEDTFLPWELHYVKARKPISTAF